MAAFAWVILSGCSKDKKVLAGGGISPVIHVVVINLESRSFDNLYGQFSGFPR
jgi:phospholipase C